MQFEATLGFNTKILHQSFFNIGASYRLDFHKDVDPEVKLEEKLMKKEERMYMKGAKKHRKQIKKEIKKQGRNQKMIEIIEVKKKSELKAFVDFQFKLYEKSPFGYLH